MQTFYRDLTNFLEVCKWFKFSSGPLSYEVRVGPNTVWRRHIDQLKETAVTLSVNKEHYNPHIDQAVLLGIPPARCRVGSEEPQPPSASDIEELPSIDTDVTNQPTNSSSCQNELTTSSSATSPPKRYPLRLRKPIEKLNL